MLVRVSALQGRPPPDQAGHAMGPDTAVEGPSTVFVCYRCPDVSVVWCMLCAKVACCTLTALRRGHRSSVSFENTKLQLSNLAKCASFCINEVECRRVLLLEYFGETFDRRNCHNTCDNCMRGGTVEMVDFTQHGIIVLKMLKEIKTKGLPTPTLIQLCKLYAGSKDKDTSRYASVTIKPESGQTRDNVIKISPLSSPFPPPFIVCIC